MTIYELTEAMIRKEKRTIDRSVRTLVVDLESEAPLVQASTPQLVQRALKMYRRIKPILALAARLPLFPPAWRGMVDAFLQTLDAIGDVDISAEFKAGKDL